jgi:Tfp pilus assembly protein FimT
VQTKSSGTTFVETLVVLWCATILVGAGLPAFHRASLEWRLWSGMQLTLSSLYWGRAYAVSSNGPVLFEVDAGGRSFRWRDPENGDAFTATERHLPAGISIVAAPARPLRFYPRGNAAPAGSFVIAGEAGRYRVVVNLAGRVRYERE